MTLYYRNRGHRPGGATPRVVAGSLIGLLSLGLTACGSSSSNSGASLSTSSESSSASNSVVSSQPSSMTESSSPSNTSSDSSEATSSVAPSGSNVAGKAGPIAAVIKGLDNTFFQTMQAGITEQASASGVKVEVQAAQSITDTTGQTDKLDALAQQDYSCYIVNPISDNNLVQGLTKVAAKKVPIVNIDRPVDAAAAKAAGVTIATYIGTDNTDAGNTAGKEMVALAGKGTVGVVGGVAGDITSNERVDGFTKAASGSLQLLPTVAADWDRQKAITAATSLMTAHPDIVGIFAANDDMGLGVSRAVANAGKTGQIKVISVDGNKDALQSIQAGMLTATVSQYPYAVGQMGVEACEALTSGKTVPANVKAPIALITKNNAATALSKFPKPFKAFEDPLASSGG